MFFKVFVADLLLTLHDLSFQILQSVFRDYSIFQKSRAYYPVSIDRKQRLWVFSLITCFWPLLWTQTSTRSVLNHRGTQYPNFQQWEESLISGPMLLCFSGLLEWNESFRLLPFLRNCLYCLYSFVLQVTTDKLTSISLRFINIDGNRHFTRSCIFLSLILWNAECLSLHKSGEDFASKGLQKHYWKIMAIPGCDWTKHSHLDIASWLSSPTLSAYFPSPSPRCTHISALKVISLFKMEK